MAVQIADRLHYTNNRYKYILNINKILFFRLQTGIYFAVDLDLIGFHNFLNGFPDVAQPDVNTGGSDASIGRISDRFQQFVVFVIEGDSESAINDSSVNMSSEIDFADVVVLKDSRVASVGRVVSGALIQRTTRRESESGLESLLANQFASRVLKSFT